MDCDKHVVDLFASREYNSSDSPDEWRGAVWSVDVRNITTDNYNTVTTTATGHSPTILRATSPICTWNVNTVSTQGSDVYLSLSLLCVKGSDGSAGTDAISEGSYVVGQLFEDIPEQILFEVRTTVPTSNTSLTIVEVKCPSVFMNQTNLLYRTGTPPVIDSSLHPFAEGGIRILSPVTGGFSISPSTNAAVDIILTGCKNGPQASGQTGHGAMSSGFNVYTTDGFVGRLERSYPVHTANVTAAGTGVATRNVTTGLFAYGTLLVRLSHVAAHLSTSALLNIYAPSPGVDTSTAIVLKDSTTWIMTSHPDLGLDLDVGDVCRIGTLQTSGYTDYVTVLEKRRVTSLVSGIMVDSVYWGSTELTGLANPTGPAENEPLVYSTTATAQSVFSAGALQALGDQTYAYRINKSIDCTTPPEFPEYGHITTTGGVRTTKLLRDRHNMRVQHTDNATGDHTRLFPLYRIKQWPKRDLRIVLDNSVRYVHWIKLVGYSIVNQRQVGFQNEHDFQNDDWVALHIDEVDGEVLSNNIAASGAFAVLHAGSDDNASTGAKEFHKYEPQGLVTHTFSSPSNMRQLTMGFLNHAGERASFGRIHLWFKVCVSQG